MGRPATGHIKTYSPTSGWGFILCDAVDRDVFFHMKNFEGEPPREHVSAAQGDVWDVEFDLVVNESERPKAYNVRLLGPPPQQSSGRRDAAPPPPLAKRRRLSSSSRREDRRGGGRARKSGVPPPPREDDEKDLPPPISRADTRKALSAPPRPPLGRIGRNKQPPPPLLRSRSCRSDASPRRRSGARPPPPPARPLARPPLPRRGAAAGDSSSAALKRPRLSRGGARHGELRLEGQDSPARSRSRGGRRDDQHCSKRPQNGRSRDGRRDRGQSSPADAPRQRRDGAGSAQKHDRSGRERGGRPSSPQAHSHRDKSPGMNGAARGDASSRQRSEDVRRAMPRAPPQREDPTCMPWDHGISNEFKLLLTDAVTSSLDGPLGDEVSRDTGGSISVAAELYGRTDLRELSVRASTGPSLRDALQKVLAEVDSHAPSSKGQDGAKTVRVKVVVPRWLASTLIGHRGMTIKDVCKSTGTLIHIEQWTLGEGDATEQIVNISGCVENILEVFARIHRYHADRSEAGDGGNDAHDNLDDNNGAETHGDLPAPPPPWKLEEHPDAPGEFYYLNTETGETTWDPPEDPNEARSEDGREGDGAEDREEPEVAKPPTPPAPWIALEHPEAPGEWYFLNEETGETSWETPGAPADEAGADERPAHRRGKEDGGGSSRNGHGDAAPAPAAAKTPIRREALRRRNRSADKPAEAPAAAVAGPQPQPQPVRREALRRRRPAGAAPAATPAATPASTPGVDGELIDGLIDEALAAAARSVGSENDVGQSGV